MAENDVTLPDHGLKRPGVVAPLEISLQAKIVTSENKFGQENAYFTKREKENQNLVRVLDTPKLMFYCIF